MSIFKTIRADLGVTQAEIADALGCTQSNVSFYERGQTVPPPVAAKLIEFARCRGKSLSYDDIYASVTNEGTPALAGGVVEGKSCLGKGRPPFEFGE